MYIVGMGTMHDLADIVVEAIITGGPNNHVETIEQKQELPHSVAMTIIAPIALLILFVGFIILAFAV